MPGFVASNFRVANRAEILADFLFSHWGTVNPVRRQDDIGADLYCTLLERAGRRDAVVGYFSVQVKSGLQPWIFNTQEEVKWLIEYPTPFFLACVEQTQGFVAVYHVMPRFLLWALGSIPARLTIIPKDGVREDSASFVDTETFILSTPILKATLSDLLDDNRMNSLGNVLKFWVEAEQDNCDLVRRGLLRFRIPVPYTVNQIPNESIMEAGGAQPDTEFLRRGIETLAEDAECLGGQLYKKGDRQSAIRALLLVYRLWKAYPAVFTKPRWQGGLPGDLDATVSKALNDALAVNGEVNFSYSGVEEVARILDTNEVVHRFLNST